MTPNLIDEHLRSCHLFRGDLLEISPIDRVSEIVATSMAAIYGFDKVYAGLLKDVVLIARGVARGRILVGTCIPLQNLTIS